MPATKPWHGRSTALAAVLALLAGLLACVALAAPASADTYDPPAGSRINNPHGDWAARNKIRRHLIRSIYSAPRGSRIRIMSWNIRDKALTSALVKVHRYKGVTVQVLMQDDNAYEHEQDPNNPIPAPGDANPDWWWMKRQLNKYGNWNRRPSRRSFARLCDASCRGGSGLAHIKLATFERVHNSRRVVMYSSGNFTKAAADIQWNDMQTVVGNRALFDFMDRRFAEAAQDRRMTNPYRLVRSGGIQVALFPWYGSGAYGDPILRALAPVHCTGAARNYGTTTGHTIVMVSQTSIGDSRGRRIASRLRQLRGQGCQVRVLYGLMGGRVKSILRGGGVPIHQLATDDDGDWIYDRYLHQKVLTVNGHYGTDRSTTITWNGSANLQDYTLRSDEILGRVTSAGTTHFYQRWILAWFHRDARYIGGSDAGTATRSDDVPEERARRAGIDPYAKFQAN